MSIVPRLLIGYSNTAPSVTDPYFSSVLLLSHFDGADGATTFTDSSSHARTLTAVGTAQLDTGTVKFGTASLDLDGTTAYASLADSADWTLGTSDFCVEGWCYASSATYIPLLTQTSGFDAAGDLARVMFGYWDGAWRVYHQVDASTFGATFADTPSTGTWFHIAFTRSGNTFRCFKDGTQVGSDVTTATTFPDIAGSLYIGTNRTDGTQRYYNGRIDDLRFTKGAARYTGNFTAPTAAFPDS